jgi:hypothetical protein
MEKHFCWSFLVSDLVKRDQSLLVFLYDPFQIRVLVELNATVGSSVDDYLDSIPWDSCAAWSNGNTYIKNINKDQTYARPNGPMFSNNQYTTGANDLSVLKLVLCRFNYERDTGNVFHKFIYENSDFDNPTGVAFHMSDWTTVQEWCTFTKGRYVAVETTDWRVMRQICKTGKYGV